MELTVQQIALILGAGLLAGFVNTMAGGGSFLTLAALEFAGLPPTIANGTNRVAIEIQTIMAVLGFRSKGVSNFKLSLHFAIPALFGAIIGAHVATTYLPKVLFHRILAMAMLVMLAILIFNPKKWLLGLARNVSVHCVTQKLNIEKGIYFLILQQGRNSQVFRVIKI